MDRDALRLAARIGFLVLSTPGLGEPARLDRHLLRHDPEADPADVASAVVSALACHCGQCEHTHRPT